MDIEKIIEEIVMAKKGNKELALFFYPDGEWVFDLGNPAHSVQLGEVSGEITTEGETLREVVCKMAAKIGV